MSDIPLILIRYASWGGHPKDNKLWEGIVLKAGDGLLVGDAWDYNKRDKLIEDCLSKGYAFIAISHKRNGAKVITSTNVKGLQPGMAYVYDAG